MGQRQLLLIVLSEIIVGIAVVVGIQMFGSSAASANKEAITSDLLTLADAAQKFYIKPSCLGGGGNSFSGLTADAVGIVKLTYVTTNHNGAYSISATGNAASVTFQGVGNHDGDGDRSNCTVRVQVFADSVYTTIVSR